MNVEVTAQLLDAFAFLLVTPEFLGKQTLASIQSYLSYIGEKIFSSGYRFSSILALFIVGFSIFLMLVGLFEILFPELSRNIIFINILHQLFSDKNRYTITAIAALPIVSSVVYFVMIIAAKLMIRRIMFGIGVVLFFLARGISVWHAWASGG